MPIVAYVGSRPIANVATPIIISETTSIFLRPDAVAEVAEDDATERAGDEAEGVGAEGQQRAR